MLIKSVVFDLDGTLVSSHETIYQATIHVLKELKINGELPREKFFKRIGLHFEDIFREFGIQVPRFEEFIKIYKSIYFDYIDSSVVYPGVNEIVEKLTQSNIKIGLLTTKAQDQAELILKHFDLMKNFDGVMGRRPGIAHKPSPEPLIKLCEELNCRIRETLIVGDSELDVECGKNAGAVTCAVTYGYREKEKLQGSHPDFLIDNIADLDYIVSKSCYAKK